MFYIILTRVTISLGFTMAISESSVILPNRYASEISCIDKGKSMTEKLNKYPPRDVTWSYVCVEE